MTFIVLRKHANVDDFPEDKVTEFHGELLNFLTLFVQKLEMLK